MAQLAIKGHATRGNEVIEILVMLGGINRYIKQVHFNVLVEFGNRRLRNGWTKNYISRIEI